jgi:hypothetical protein
MPAGDRLEQFCLELGEYLRSQQESTQLVFLIANLFADYFTLKYPIAPQIASLLDNLEIVLEYVDHANAEPTTYTYSYDRGKWVIFLREDAGRMDVVHILHEVFEILWWRCSYLIPEWSQWVSLSKIRHPHEVAEEFAQGVILPVGVFGELAKQHGYNPITLGGIFQVPAGVCFQQILRLQIAFPYIQARLDFTRTPTQGQFDFDEAGDEVQIVTKGCKLRKSLKPSSYPEMRQLEKGLAKRKSFIFLEGWINEAMETKSAQGRETDIVLGVRLPRTVFVALRPQREKAFLQIVPMKYRDRLIDELIAKAILPPIKAPKVKQRKLNTVTS